MVELNSTVNGLNQVGDASGWLITVLVFLLVVVTIYLLSKNFRQFIHGAIVAGSLFAVYSFSRWIGKSYGAGNYEPLIWTGKVIGFILVSIGIGKMIDKLNLFKLFQKKKR